MWPDVAVEESSLNQAIARMRKELGDTGDIIETVPRRGYRLTVRPERIDAPEPAPTKGRWRAPAVAAVALVAVCLSTVVAWPRWSKHRQATALVEEGFRLVREDRTLQVAEATSRFSRALELEPQLAVGYAGLAEAMARSVDGSRIHAAEMAKRSLAVDPNCAECQGVAGWIGLTYQWRFDDAFRLLGTAARKRPRDATIQLWNAQATACSGRFEQALRQIDQAVALSPADAAPQAMRAGILYFMGRYSDSMKAGRLALGLRSGYTAAYDWIYRSGLASGRVEEALAARAALMASFNGMSFDARDQYERRWNTAYRKGGVVRLLEEILGDSASALARRDQCYDRASLRAWARDGQGAIDELEHVFEGHPFHSIYLGVDPIFADIRDDLRFRRIVGRIGLDKILVAQK